MSMRVNMSRLKNKGFVSLVIILIVILIGVIIFFVSTANNPSPEPLVEVSIKTDLAVPSPTSSPFPFQELTIPYLQSRKYESKLSELEKLSENANYTTYLTSYDSDGMKINGLLTIPNPSTRSGQIGIEYPAVVFVHGYIPPSEYKTTKNYVSYVNQLASKGLVVLKIDLRGHDASEGDAHGAYYSEGYVVDTLNAYGALKAADFVDPNRIGLWGHSMAGNVVFRSLAVKPNIPKVVIWAGAIYTYEDFATFRISDNSWQPPPHESERQKRREELFDTYGDFDPESEFWKQVPGTNYLDDIKGAVQIHHAINDGVVKIGYSRNLVNILNKAGIKNELFEYPSGGHNLTGASFTQAMQRSADFLKE